MSFTIIPKKVLVKKYKFLKDENGEYLKDCDGDKLIGVIFADYLQFLWFKFKIKSYGRK